MLKTFVNMCVFIIMAVVVIICATLLGLGLVTLHIIFWTFIGYCIGLTFLGELIISGLVTLGITGINMIQIGALVGMLRVVINGCGAKQINEQLKNKIDENKKNV